MPSNTTIRFGSASAVVATANYRLPSSAASTNANVVKASKGTITGITGFNANAAPRYLKLYDKATSPIVGTDTPVWMGIMPAQDSIAYILGLTFVNGIALALTTGPEDADTGAVGAGEVVALNIAYA